MSKYVYKYVFVLSEGMRKVSDGDFSVRLDEGKGGPLGEVYVDFNKMCAELENVEMLKNDFLNNYAHELRTPITSINGFARLLMETTLPRTSATAICSSLRTSPNGWPRLRTVPCL